MRFVLRMAWRDSKASRRRLLAYSVCIVFGIAALVALDSFNDTLAGAIAQQSKDLLGADLVVTSRAPFPAPVLAYLRALGASTAEETVFSSMMTVPSAGGRTHLVQVRAESGDFPFYGSLITDPAAAARQLRDAQATGAPVVVLEGALLAQFHLHPGDRVRLGRADFRVAGAVSKVSGESPVVVQLAPRAYVPQSSLSGSGLDLEGPLVRRRLAAELPPGVDARRVVAEMRERFGADRFSYETVADRRRQLGRALSNVDGFLNLGGFIALLLGAIGVASAIHVHVRQKVPTVAVLRCLGTGTVPVTGIYVAQGVALGVVGAAVGAAIGIAIQAAIPALFGALIPLPLHFALAGWAIFRGMATGIVVCVLFSLAPLISLRRVSPLAALRSDISGTSGADPALVGLGLAITAAVAGLACWQTGSLPMGLGFTGALGLGLLALAALARAVAAAARRWTPRSFPYAVRQGMANLHRPQNRTVLLLVALGLGTFLFLTLFLTRTAFLRELRFVGAADRPNLMFFDIQPDQIGALDRLLAAGGAPVLDQAPLVSMRIEAVRGVPVTELLKARGSRVGAWALRREYRVTYRGRLSDTERVVSGTFTGQVPPGASPIPISVDEGLAKDLALSIGTAIDWNVEGVVLHSVVGSIRMVDWRRLEPNFFVVFPDGVLEDAPQSFVAAVRAPDAQASGRLQAAGAQAFPNVSAIDLSALLQTLDGVFGKVAFVVEFMALFTAATAVVVLAAAVFAGRHQRRREVVLLRTLGASRRQLARIQATEYAALGLLAGALGSVLAWSAAQVLARHVFRLRPAAPPAVFIAGIAVVVATTLATGWLADHALLRQPPLESLRSEG